MDIRPRTRRVGVYKYGSPPGVGGLQRSSIDMKRDPHPVTPAAADVLSTQPISLDVLREKYLKADEQDAEALFARVARALASVEP